MFGETLTVRRGSVAEPAVVPPIRDVEALKEVVVPPSKQPPPLQHPIQRLYPRLPPAEDDEFEYFDTPSKPRPQTREKPHPVDEEIYDWEDYDDDTAYKKSVVGRISSPKRPRFEVESIDDLDFSPPRSPKKHKTLSDPFTTPPKQITSTPHTPPETRPAQQTPGTNLLPLSYSLLHQLSPHSATLGVTLWQSLREHLLRCGRVADGAIKGRDSARAVSRKKDIKIEELERRVRILEAQREVDRAVVGALKRNVDVLTGRVERTD